MRTDANSRWRVLHTNVREEEQHEQCPAFRSNVDTPFKVGRDRLLRCIACIDMPTGVSGVHLARKADWKSSKALSWKPPSATDQLVKCSMERRRVRSYPKGLLRTVTDSNHRTSPCLWVIRITACFTPENCSRVGCNRGRKGVLDTDEAIANKLLSMFFSQQARC